MRFLAVGVGAVLGANLRYVVANWAAARWGAEFPYGTFIINVTGAFVIGLFLAAVGSRVGLNPLWRVLIVTGFLGGYTTFSSYTWEAFTLAEGKTIALAALYVLGSNALGLLGVWAGAAIGSRLA